MYNKLILIGNLTKDIDLKYITSGVAIANGNIATSYKYKLNNEQREEVCFLDFTIFAKSAEIAKQYLRKGSKVMFEGRLKLEQWIDNSGQKKSKHYLIVESMKMLEDKNKNKVEMSKKENISYVSKNNDIILDDILFSENDCPF